MITVELLDGKPINSEGLRYKYLVKKTMQPFKVQPQAKPKPLVQVPQITKTATPISKTTKGGIKLRERTAPLKYTVDDDYDLSDHESDDDEPFPTTRQVTETWQPEVRFVLL